ncbi:serine-pyruvate transaminase [Aureococcus anophagefferens]|nr:serine-pyruvate transaminase [Aureococcus anophagefferens]
MMPVQLRAALRALRSQPATCGLASVAGREPLLFTPGPLTTSISVKQAMLRDLGSRDPQFIELVRSVRSELLTLADTSQEAGYECVLVPGSGTTTVESVVSSVIPPGGRLLVVSNGAYGDRIATMCAYHGIAHDVLRSHEARAVSPAAVAAHLAAKPAGYYGHVAMIHHETTAGTLNDVDAVGKLLHAHDPELTFIVDSMSGFGCYAVDLEGSHVDYVVSSANKNIEGVPGFGFAIAKRDKLLSQGVHARALSLDLLKQWEGLEGNGQFRFTPPVQSLMAFKQALAEMFAEGGVAGRRARYEANAAALVAGIAALGSATSPAGAATTSRRREAPAQGCIIHTYLFPTTPTSTSPFYDRLAELGIVIYPGKLTEADCFRVGSIGRMFERDMVHLTSSVKIALEEQGVALPVAQIDAPLPEPTRVAA